MASELYFPAPYAIMTTRILESDYGSAFVTYPEVHQSWVIVTAGDEAICLDPPGAVVRVYNPPDDCGNTPPDVCYTGQTVQDEYDVTFACTDENDVTYECRLLPGKMPCRRSQSTLKVYFICFFPIYINIVCCFDFLLLSIFFLLCLSYILICLDIL